MPLHHSGHVSAIKSQAIKLKSCAVDQRGCQIYVWLGFCQAQAGNIWTEMLSVMWQSFTTGCTLLAQDNSGSEIWSRWRTLEYFTVDLVFNFKSVQSTKKSLFTNHHKTLWRRLDEERLLLSDRYPELLMSITCFHELQRRFSAFYTISCDRKWTSFNTIPTLLNLRRPLLWNVF